MTARRRTCGLLTQSSVRSAAHRICQKMLAREKAPAFRAGASLYGSLAMPLSSRLTPYRDRPAAAVAGAAVPEVRPDARREAWAARAASVPSAASAVSARPAAAG